MTARYDREALGRCEDCGETVLVRDHCDECLAEDEVRHETCCEGSR